jgi:glycerol kinase
MIETTSAGAAYLAALGVGLFDDVNDIKKIWKIDRTFRAKLDDSGREVRLARWALAVKRAMVK